MRRKTSGGEIVFGLLNIPALIIVGSLWSGYVLSQLWAWFVVPTFEFPLLTWPVAYGMALILGLSTAGSSEPQDGTKREMIELVVAGWVKVLMRPLIFLVMGWIVSRFV